jgi:CrcB protein
VDVWVRVLALSAGGVFGVNARYWLGVWMNRWASPQFPWATFTINISGSFAIGFLTVALARWLPHSNIRLLVLTGFLGGYTTFSSYTYESAALWERGEVGLALANLFGSVVVGFAAVVLGIVLARGLVIPEPERSATRRAHATGVPGTEPPRPLDVVAGEPVTPEVGPVARESADGRSGGPEALRT